MFRINNLIILLIIVFVVFGCGSGDKIVQKTKTKNIDDVMTMASVAADVEGWCYANFRINIVSGNPKVPTIDNKDTKFSNFTASKFKVTEKEYIIPQNTKIRFFITNMDKRKPYNVVFNGKDNEGEEIKMDRVISPENTDVFELEFTKSQTIQIGKKTINITAALSNT